jgi:hypothetical protein
VNNAAETERETTPINHIYVLDALIFHQIIITIVPMSFQAPATAVVILVLEAKELA